MPIDHPVDDDLIEVGTLTRREVSQVVVAYSFDLRSNELETTLVANPNAGREHIFKAYRIEGDPLDPVSLREQEKVIAAQKVK
ncbi:hypothetical protein [Nitrosococcus oceani]|uniref:hypothetical protein n=1 Tax=Nitrosococcus oceani TaxID=1229 RepID=UPI001FD2B155|nr:hypothetical protein [Nitrosococcus oceani]